MVKSDLVQYMSMHEHCILQGVQVREEMVGTQERKVKSQQSETPGLHHSLPARSHTYCSYQINKHNT